MPCSSSISSTSLRLRLDCDIGFILGNPRPPPQMRREGQLAAGRSEAYAPGLAIVLLRPPQEKSPTVPGVDHLVEVPAIGRSLAKALGKCLAVGDLVERHDLDLELELPAGGTDGGHHRPAAAGGFRLVGLLGLVRVLFGAGSHRTDCRVAARRACS